MDRDKLLATRLVVLFLIGCVLFGYPFVWLFTEPTAGVPALVIYVFGAWLAFIVVVALCIELVGRRGSK